MVVDEGESGERLFFRRARLRFRFWLEGGVVVDAVVVDVPVAVPIGAVAGSDGNEVNGVGSGGNGLDKTPAINPSKPASDLKR